MAEDDLIAWLRATQAAHGESSLIGDDAAVVPQQGDWAITMDTQQEGVHFFPGTDPELVARRLLAVNLSDLAAMGARPELGFLALAAPLEFDHRRFFAALIEEGRRYGIRLAGGDLSRAPHCMTVLTLLGRKNDAQRWLRRDGARPGHVLWVGGSLGEASLGLALLERVGGPSGLVDGLPPELDLSPEQRDTVRRAIRRHLQPTPQLELGHWLGSQSEGAAMDISDGLAKDLHRLCGESGVGARVQEERLPVASSMRSLGDHLGVDVNALALFGGEDYVLLFTLPEGLDPPSELGCQAIGEILAPLSSSEPTETSSVILCRGSEETQLPAEGWDHFASSSIE